MEAYVGGEGYTTPSGFILKEMCIMFPNKEYNHYLFKSDSFGLSDNDFKTIRYAMKTINKLSFHDGDTPSHHLDEILQRYKEYTIYTYSEVMQKRLQHHLPTTIVINAQDEGLKLASELPDPKCFREHPHRYCAKAKAIAIRKFMDNEDNVDMKQMTW